VSVSSLNDGFFLLHTDTENNSGKVQDTHTDTDRQTVEWRCSYNNISNLHYNNLSALAVCLLIGQLAT